MGVKFVYVLRFSSGKGETHKQNSQKISGKCRDSPGIILGHSLEILVYVFSCFLVFLALIIVVVALGGLETLVILCFFRLSLSFFSLVFSKMPRKT